WVTGGGVSGEERRSLPPDSGDPLPASDTVAPGAAVTAEPVGQAAAGEPNDLGGDAAVAVARLPDQLRLTCAEVADRHCRAGRAVMACTGTVMMRSGSQTGKG